MKSYFLLLLGLIVVMGSCKDDEPKPMLPKRGEVNLTTPLSRQKTTYQKFSTSCKPGSFDTDTDTIILEVILDDGKKYFEEYGTPGSMSSEIRNHRTRMEVLPEVGVLRIFDRSESYLFASLPKDEILLDSSFSQTVWQDGCAILTISDSTVFAGVQPGLITNFSLDTILSLDQKYMYTEPEQPDDINKYILYDGRHMYVSYDEELQPALASRMVGWIRVER